MDHKLTLSEPDCSSSGIWRQKLVELGIFSAQVPEVKSVTLTVKNIYIEPS
jgi:hypothetical protein